MKDLKKEQEFDALFRNKLAKQTKKPSPQAWEKIEAGLQSKKRRGVVVWRIAAGVALLSGFALIYQMYQNQVQANLVASKKIEKTSKVAGEARKSVLQNNDFQANNGLQNSIEPTTKTTDKTANKLFVAKNLQKNNAVKVNKIASVAALEVAKQGKQDKNEQFVGLLPNNEVKELVLNEKDSSKTTLVAVAEVLPTKTTLEEENENQVEVIVKVDNTTNMLAEVNQEVPKKRKLFGRIWHKLKEGEALTLQDVGVNPEKLPKFLRSEKE
jgi:hypothetical protein